MQYNITSAQATTETEVEIDNLINNQGFPNICYVTEIDNTSPFQGDWQDAAV